MVETSLQCLLSLLLCDSLLAFKLMSHTGFNLSGEGGITQGVGRKGVVTLKVRGRVVLPSK